MESKYIIKLHLWAAFGVFVAVIGIIMYIIVIVYEAVMMAKQQSPTQVMIIIMTSLSLILSCFEVRLFTSLKKCDSPFTDDVITKLDNFIAVLVVFIICSIIASMIQQFMNIHLDGNWSIGDCVTIVIMLILANSFRYGLKLQKESDETL